MILQWTVGDLNCFSNDHFNKIQQFKHLCDDHYLEQIKILVAM